MRITTDFMKTEFVQDAIREDRANMLRGLLQEKFRVLPSWAEDQLAHASPAQLARWFKKILSSDTLEELLANS